ncbi:hypothetical protein BGK67_10950 [Streptomyces subrutilus]|uniref:LPXTG cell wall anchor domain-containing protein n=1 Tax=Streptomyces subrutilus TaxID=36818 RepID=A0A1E5PQF1_9ACTN|nr:hypothetical protein BGK67_10950 [Streptomyces subrutilus]
MQDGGPVRVGGGRSQVVQDDDDRVPGGGPLPADPQHELLVAQVQGGGGLVEEQQRRPLGQYAGQRDPGPPAAGQRGERAGGEVGDLGRCHGCGHRLLVRVGERRAGPGRGPSVRRKTGTLYVDVENASGSKTAVPFTGTTGGTGCTGGTGAAAATVGGSPATTGAEIPAGALLGTSGAVIAAGAGAVLLARRRRVAER